MSGYSDVVLDHFLNPRNARRMIDPTVVGTAGVPGTGAPFMVLYLKLGDTHVLDASFQTYGCGPCIAAGSVLTEGVKGSSIATARTWGEGEVLSALGGLPESKRHCAALAAEALRKALEGVE